MTTDTYTRRVEDAIRAQFEEIRVFPALVRLLAEGEPVSIAHLAAAAGVDVEEVNAELAKHPSVEWDERGRLVGLGLTLRQTPHRFTFEGRAVADDFEIHRQVMVELGWAPR